MCGPVKFVMFTPRSRALDTSCRIWPLMVYNLVSGFCLRYILMDSHFLTFNFIPFLLLYAMKWSKSCCRASWSLAWWIGNKRQTSANNRTLEVTSSGHVVMCRKNNSDIANIFSNGVSRRDYHQTYGYSYIYNTVRSEIKVFCCIVFPDWLQRKAMI